MFVGLIILVAVVRAANEPSRAKLHIAQARLALYYWARARLAKFCGSSSSAIQWTEKPQPRTLTGGNLGYFL